MGEVSQRYRIYRQQFYERLEELGKYNKTKQEIFYEVISNKNKLRDNSRELFKKLALTHHPDKGGSNDTFIKIKEAYEENNYFALKRYEMGKVKTPSISENEHNDFMEKIYKESIYYQWGQGNLRGEIEAMYMNYDEAIYFHTLLLRTLEGENYEKELYHIVNNWELIKDKLIFIKN